MQLGPTKLVVMSSRSHLIFTKIIDLESKIKTENIIEHLGLSENSVPLHPMVLLIIIPTSNGYFIGGIPHFQTYPSMDDRFPKAIGFPSPEEFFSFGPRPSQPGRPDTAPAIQEHPSCSLSQCRAVPGSTPKSRRNADNPCSSLGEMG